MFVHKLALYGLGLDFLKVSEPDESAKIRSEYVDIQFIWTN